MIHLYYAKDKNIINDQISKNKLSAECEFLNFKEINLHTLYNKLMTIDLFGSPNEIILENFLPIETKTKVKQKDVELITAIANDSSSQLHVILNNSINKNNIVLVNLLNSYTYFEYVENENNFKELLKAFCLEENINIQTTNLTYLIDLLDNDYLKIKNELLRLSLVSQNQTITKDIINNYCSYTKEQSNFLLFDYVLSKNKKETEKYIEQLTESGGDLISLLSGFRSHLSFCLSVKLLSQSNSLQATATLLNSNLYRIKKVHTSLERISIFHLMTLVENMAEMDYLVKTGQLDPHIAITGIVNN